MSTVVSADGRLVAGSIRRRFAGSVNSTRTRPFSRRLRKSPRLVAVDMKIVGVDRPEQRIVRPGIPSASLLQQLEPGFRARRRQLELVRRHVTVGAGTSIAIEAMQRTIEEGEEPAEHGIAGLAAAGSRMLDLSESVALTTVAISNAAMMKRNFPLHMFLPLRFAKSPQRNLAAGGTKILGGSMKNPDLLCS